MKIDSWLSATAAALPDQVALVAGEDSLTYADLDRRARSAARRLVSRGVDRGDRVALLTEHSAEYVVILHALVKIGAIAVPLDQRLSDTEVDALLGAVEPRLIVRESAEVLEAAEASDVVLDEEIDLEAINCVIHTSGSGGRPKPVELTYGNHLWNAIGSGVRIGVAPTDRWLCCLPLHHVGGFAIVLRSALYRTGIVLEPFESGAVASTIAREPVTVISLVPTMLTRLLDEGAELDQLRCLLLGGGPCPQPLMDRALDAGVPLSPTYGLTEAASQVATMSPGETRLKPGSAGPPILTTEVKIDEQDGTILVRGPSVAPNAAGPDEWLRTNDFGRLDEEGYLYVLGRADEVIVSGGENISPEEVERVLLEHPAVVDAGVTAEEHPEWQEAVVARVVLHDGQSVSAEELQAFCRERLAGFKVPKQIEFVAELPRNAQGKLLRRDLKRT
jgi:O-succinylbenzoic acid--CoA ligase